MMFCETITLADPEVVEDLLAGGLADSSYKHAGISVLMSQRDDYLPGIPSGTQ
jgi:hypothetical protein